MKAEDSSNKEAQEMEVDQGYEKELYAKSKANVPLKSITVSHQTPLYSSQLDSYSYLFLSFARKNGS